MRRLLGAFIFFALVIAAGVFIADRPGNVSLEWNGWQIDTSVGVLVLAVLAGFLALAVVWRILRAIVGAPGAFRKARRERRRRDGYRALTQGMVAVAAGEADEALRLARKADVLLAEPPLTLLLQAQAAQLNGDEGAAQRYFTAMLDRPETEFLGVRGLLTQALKSGQEGTALELAARARRLRPKTAWALVSLFELQARAGQWAEAEETLTQALRRRALPVAEGKRAEAALLLERSRAASAAGDARAALDLAGRAQDADPGFAPAAVWRASLLRDGGRLRQATRALETAWRIAPEPAVALTFQSLVPEETPLQRIKRLERLADANPDHAETHLMMAEAALRAQLWGEARRHLALAGIGDDGALAASPPARACRLMAELAEQERHDGAAARLWLARAAASAALDPTYVCAKCGTESTRWVAVCPTCRAFASYAWGVPRRAPRDLLADAGARAALPPAKPAESAGSSARPSVDAAQGRDVLSAAVSGAPIAQR